MRDADLQVHGAGGQPQRECADDGEREPERDAAEAPASDVVELAELRDRLRRCLNARCQRHGNWEREQDGDESGVGSRA